MEQSVWWQTLRAPPACGVARALAGAGAVRRRSDARCAADKRQQRDTSQGTGGEFMPPRRSAN